MLKGYTGRYLRVDLSSQKIYKERINAHMPEEYLGGSGFCTKTLWDEVRTLEDPFSPENRLIFATGPLTGTFWPCSGRTVVAGISPLTGLYGDANAGGAFAPALKRCGYDYIIIEGSAIEPKYLCIKGKSVELHDAREIWFKGTYETEERIKNVHGKAAGIQIACIGTAGANLVRFSGVFFTGHRSASRCGLGALMGSKKLKAIAVAPPRNNRAINWTKQSILGVIGQKEKLQSLKGLIHLLDHLSFLSLLAEPLKFTVCALKWRLQFAKSPFCKSLRDDGTPILVSYMSEIGRLPTKNFQTGSFDFFEDISSEALKPFVKEKYLGCYGCPILCDKHYRANGIDSHNLEYETLCSLGSKCGNNDIVSIIEANRLCDDLGMDTISAGGVISFLMELYERGLLPQTFAEDLTDGESLEWGNKKLILELLKKMAKREGKADYLAEGIERLANQLGEDTLPYAMHVKGMEMPGQDGRAQKSMGLAQAVSSRGADHLKGFPTVDELNYGKILGDPDFTKKRFGKVLPGIENPRSSEHKAFLVKDGEDFCSVIDSVGICKFGTFSPPLIYWEELAEGLKLATGFDYSKNELKTTGERICNLQRMINLSHGLRPEDDTLPKRFLNEGSPTGAARGETIELKALLDEYYQLRDWDPKTGYPSPNILKKLGL